MEVDEIEVVDSDSKEQAVLTKTGKLFMAFAFCALIAAYLFVSLVPLSDNPLGYLILTAVFFGITIVFALITGGRFSLYSALAVVVGLAVSLFRMIHGNAFLFPAFLINALLYAYLVVSLYGNHSRSLGGRFLLDIAKGVAYMFISFGCFFKDLFKPRGSKKNSAALLIVLAGVVAALVLLLIVGSLLSYDKNFAAMMPKIDLETISDFIIKLLFTVPVAAVIYSIYASSRERKLPSVSSEESFNRTASCIKVIPMIIIALPIAALLIMYVLFFISQWAYYMSAFTHALPEGYSAAEYAREGFFQLCAVACINAFLIVVLECFAKKSTKGMNTLSRVLSILLSLATLVLIATAISKMLLYIDLYDMTRDRLYVTVFLVFLALAFVIVILSVLFKKVKALPLIIGIAIIFLVVFSLVNTDRFIAKYNVDAYLSGKHSNIDIDYLEKELDLNAFPELIRLNENAVDPSTAQSSGSAVSRLADSVKNEKLAWYKIDIPYLNAKKMLKTYEIN